MWVNKLSVTIIVHNPDLLDSYQVSDHPHVDVHDHLHLVRAGPDVTLYDIRTTSNSSASSTKGTANIHSQVICKFLDLVEQLQVSVQPHVVAHDHPHHSESKAGCRPKMSSGPPRTAVRAAPKKGQPTFTINLQVFFF